MTSLELHQVMYRRAQFKIFGVAAVFLFLETCPTMYIERILITLS